MKANQIKIGKKIWMVTDAAIPSLKHYKNSKKAKVGSTLRCVMCETTFVKKKETYVFCCIPCKDDFWNKIDPRKRNNNGKNRNQKYVGIEPHWCDNDWADCDYHNKEDF